MNYDVPSSIIGSEFDRVPPVRIEGSIRKPCELRPQIEPAMQEAKEPENEKQHWGEHEIDDCIAQSFKVDSLLKLFNGLFVPTMIKNKCLIVIEVQ